jgi:hypothetical protein
VLLGNSDGSVRCFVYRGVTVLAGSFQSLRLHRTFLTSCGLTSDHCLLPQPRCCNAWWLSRNNGFSEVALRGAGSGQHPNWFKNLLHSMVQGVIRFLLGWLFLHRRLRARQRGSRSEDLSGIAPVRLIISEGRYPFLSE